MYVYIYIYIYTHTYISPPVRQPAGRRNRPVLPLLRDRPAGELLSTLFCSGAGASLFARVSRKNSLVHVFSIWILIARLVSIWINLLLV